MSMDILKEDIKNNKLRNLYLFYGEEDYLKKYYCDSLEKIILRDDVTGLNKITFDGKTEVYRIIEACETMPVFVERKFVVVKNSGLFKSQKESSGNKNSKEEFLDYLKGFPDYTCLVFIEESIDKRLKLVDVIKKAGLIVDFPYRKQNELVKWAVNIIRSGKKEIDQDTAAYLIGISEQGMNEILNEINKLVLYLGERAKVTVADIDKVCTKSIKSRIFDLTDAISQREEGLALKLLNDMVSLREPIPKILFMITRQLRHLLEMKTLIDEGINLKDACSIIGIPPFLGSKVLKQVQSFNAEDLKNAVKEALDLDLAIKTGRVNDRIGTEMLIFNLARTK
ncbi:MAG: DNA polymerase III subunit delta [Clostridiaceae bacterium]|nr:DNA polymerase III subunit delta [Clostridiaceae bacterium]